MKKDMAACPVMGGAGSYGGIAVEWGTATDVGLTRAVNEDSLLAALPIFVVADGMGGHHAGDVASRLVVEEFERSASRRSVGVDDIAATMQTANDAIFREGERDVDRSGMGTTAVGLALVDNGDATAWLVFNVGDSRAYCLSGGELEQLSVDHSYVQELIAAGELTKQDARAHPNRNVVTRALGVESGLQPDYWFREPRAGERYLLCSDGLTTEVSDAEIRAVLVAASSAGDAASELVHHALTAGGHDNVTVLVLDVLSVTLATAIRPEDTAPRGAHATDLDPVAPLDPVEQGMSPEEVDGLLEVTVSDVPSVPESASDLAPSDVDEVALIEGVPEFETSSEPLDELSDAVAAGETPPVPGDDPGDGGAADG